MFIISSCGWMKVSRRLRRWSMTSWIMLSSTPAHASIRRCIKSFTSCTFVLWTRCWIMLQFLSSIGLTSRLFSGRRSGRLWGDHDLWDYCTFRMEAANYAQSVWVNTASGKDHIQKHLREPRYCGIATYTTKSLQSSGKPIILFISSRRTSHHQC